MPSEHSQRLLIYAVTFIIILASLGITYSMSTDTGGVDGSDKQRQTSAPRLPFGSYINGNEVILVKDEKLVIGKTCLDFKGLSGKSIMVDLYLLDLDNEQPYPKKIKLEEAEKGFRLGDYKYRLVSAKASFIKLERHGKL